MTNQPISVNDCSISVESMRNYMTTLDNLQKMANGKTILPQLKSRIEREIASINVVIRDFYAWEVAVEGCSEFDKFLFSSYFKAAAMVVSLRNASIDCKMNKITKNDMFDCEILKGIDNAAINTVGTVRKCISANNITV